VSDVVLKMSKSHASSIGSSRVKRGVNRVHVIMAQLSGWEHDGYIRRVVSVENT
jgi:hypothetical protein